MNIKYLIRLDDACSTMDIHKWKKIEKILDKYFINPIVGIVPNNEDADLIIGEIDIHFWDKVKEWKAKGWCLALHGYNHVYLTEDGGMNPIWSRSEFAGVPLNIQKQKIRDGISILREKNIDVKVFFPPSHTFDENTIIALQQESNIRIINDTIALKPYKKYNMILVPQQLGRFRKIKIPGCYTFCFHPNIMEEKDFVSFENFIMNNRKHFISIDDFDFSAIESDTILNKFIRKLYFCVRNVR